MFYVAFIIISWLPDYDIMTMILCIILLLSSAFKYFADIYLKLNLSHNYYFKGLSRKCYANYNQHGVVRRTSVVIRKMTK